MQEKTTESLPFGAGLMVSAGLMDAYSYLCRGKVLANAQTGNILLMGVHLVNGNWEVLPQYVSPVFAFAFGVFLGAVLKNWLLPKGNAFRKRTVLLLAASGLLAAGLFSQENNLIANSLVSLVCGLQLESFLTVEGFAMATTMCIGNLRVVIHSLAEYAFTRDRAELKKAGTFAFVILCFMAGAVAASILIPVLAEKAIWGSAAVLTVMALTVKE